jgi:hypothetical protein
MESYGKSFLVQEEGVVDFGVLNYAGNAKPMEKKFERGMKDIFLI